MKDSQQRKGEKERGPYREECLHVWLFVVVVKEGGGLGVVRAVGRIDLEALLLLTKNLGQRVAGSRGLKKVMVGW